MKPRIHPTEAALQQQIVKLLEAYARHEIEWHHVPNGEDRHPAVARRLKLMGVKKGVADLMFMIEGQSIAVELKTDIGTQSRDQADWQERFERAGGRYFMARGLDEAIGVLKAINAFRPNIQINIALSGNGARNPAEFKEARSGTHSNQSPSEVRA